MGEGGKEARGKRGSRTRRHIPSPRTEKREARSERGTRGVSGLWDVAMRSPAALLPLYRARQEVTEQEECVEGRAPVDRWTSQLLASDPDHDIDRGLAQFDDLGTISKSVPDRNEADASNSIFGNLIRLYNAGDGEPVELPADLESSLHALPSLPSLKRAQTSLWYHQKGYKVGDRDAGRPAHPFAALQSCILTQAEEDVRNFDSDEPGDPSPIHGRHQSRKSLPHKKRISRKLKKNLPHRSETLDCNAVDDKPVPDVVHEGEAPHPSSDHHALSEANLVGATLHSNRSMFICQLCGDFYGDDQLKFFYHLKHHYEPHGASLILENMPHDENSIALDKIDGSIVISNEPLPDSLVDLSSLDDPVSGKSLLYQSQNKMSDYEETAKAMYDAALKPSLYQPENKQMVQDDADKFSYMGDSPVDKLLYACTMCSKTFKRQKQYEMHVKDSHSKVEEISEFSEPEDMMEGIHVVVDGENEEYAQEDLSTQNSNSMIIQNAMDNQDQYILPHLTIENGHVVPHAHMDSKEWYSIKANMNEKDLKNDNAATLSKVVSDEENMLTENTADESKDEFAKSEELIVCPVCGGVLSNRKEYDSHVIQCHMDLKEEEIQRMMDFEVDVSDIESGEIGSLGNVDNVELDAESEEIEEPEKEETKKGKSEKAIFTCNVCTKQFKHRNSVIYHMVSHEGGKSFPCEVCKKSFITGAQLKVHKKLHNGDKPFKCVECSRMFRQWGDLKYHFISIHSDVKQHQCEYCGKNFARKYSLIVHRRIHTGEKNYRCEFCQKTFRASSYLQNHRKIHTGERPYPCELCGKRFRMRGDMRRHQRVHNKTTATNKEKVDDKMLSSDSSNGSTKIMKAPSSGTSDSKEMKTEKEEMHGETEEDDSSAEIKLVSDGTPPSVHSEPQESKSGSSFPLENNTMYMWPVFIA